MGIGQDLCRVRGCFRSCRCRSPTSLDVEVLDDFVFISLFRVFSLLSGPLEREIKKVHHTKNSPRKRNAWPRSVCQGSNAGLYYGDTARPKTWYRNFEYSTESKPEEKKARKTCPWLISKVEAWLGQFCSVRLCFLDVVPYRYDTTPGLFRTRLVGCYVLPCISIKLWRTTCKPYSPKQPGCLSWHSSSVFTPYWALLPGVPLSSALRLA